MADSPMGASIRKGDEVLIAEKSDEKDLSRGLGVSVDDSATGLIHLADLKDENDLMHRSPVVGSIDLAREMGGQRIGELTKALQGIVGDFSLTGAGAALESAAGAANDLFAVEDAEWIQNIDELSWRSPLAAQLTALGNASEAMLLDPVRADFAQTLSDAERIALAARARELASELTDEVLGEILLKVQKAKSVDAALQSATVSELESYAGGSTDDPQGIEKTELSQYLTQYLKGLGR